MPEGAPQGVRPGEASGDEGGCDQEYVLVAPQSPLLLVGLSMVSSVPPVLLLLLLLWEAVDPLGNDGVWCKGHGMSPSQNGDDMEYHHYLSGKTNHFIITAIMVKWKQ